jgi:hypothetical protein
MRVRLLKSLVILNAVLMAFASTNVAQRPAAAATARQTETLLIRIETKLDVLREEADRVAEARQSNAGDPEAFRQQLTTLEQATARLRESFDARDTIADEATEVLTAARQIDQFLVRNRISSPTQSQWRSLRRDFDTLATYNRISWNWNQTTPGPVLIGTSPGTPAYTVSDSQMRTLLSRIDLKTGIYRRQMETALRADTSADVSDAEVFAYITALESASARLRQRFDGRQSTTTDATDLLAAATQIDQFMNRNRLSASAQAQWRNLKADLNTLATNYRVAWNWNQTLPTTGTGTGGVRNFDRRITGTYRLNTGLSEEVGAVVDRTMGSASTATREGARARLERRLRSPEIIAIEMSGQTVNLASSVQPRVTFNADGVARSETNANGRTVTTTATVDDDGLIVNYQGERANDFYLTFLPMADGKLRVTRRIYTEGSGESITVSSVYDKIDTIARWTSVTMDTTTGAVATAEDTFVVPAGTRMSAELVTPITGDRIPDRFTMEVRTPSQFRGAIISGRVLTENASSRVAGQARVMLAFDTIRLPSGRTHRFAGTVDTVAAVNGDLIQVTNQTATARPAGQSRNGAGAILGALIGAIAGVPVDASASTDGAVLTQRGDRIDLGAGSQITLTALAPRN